MSQAGIHPEAEKLIAYRDGLLPEAAAEEIRRHLGTCDECRELAAIAGAESAEKPAPLDDATLARLTRGVLAAGELRILAFTTDSGILVADHVPSLLPQPTADSFFAAARTAATRRDSLDLAAGGLAVGLGRQPDGALTLDLAGTFGELVLWSDDFGQRDTIPREDGHCRLEDIPADGCLEFSVVRDGRHERLVLECRAALAAAGDPALRPHLERAAARALADGRIAAFAQLETDLAGRVPGVTALAAVMAGWRSMALESWAGIVLLGRAARRGPADERDFIVIGEEAEEARLEEMQPWLPFEAGLVRRKRDDSAATALADSAFFNIARKQLCEQTLRILDREYADGLGSPTLYRTRAWLLYATGNLVEAMYNMEQAMFHARGDERMQQLHRDCRRDYRVLAELDKGDAARWPVVPQDIFDSLWRLGAERLGRDAKPEL